MDQTKRLQLKSVGNCGVLITSEEDPETEAFMPLLSEAGSHEVRNAALLYFAAGLLLIGLTPVFLPMIHPAARMPKKKQKAVVTIPVFKDM